MPYLMGIDLGTSSLKTLIVTPQGELRAESAGTYQFDSPRNGYAEQDPAVWWEACVSSIKAALAKPGISPGDIKALSFSGQMHGAVFLDADRKPVRPAILHCDTRSGAAVEKIKTLLTEKNLFAGQYNPIYTGFLLVSLFWLRENEPQNYGRIQYVMLPKDFLKMKLCGEICSDYSDASATLAFDIERFTWSREILDALDISSALFPPCFASDYVTGRVTDRAASETGLDPLTLVVNGGGDQVMQALGNGAALPGQATVNIGSSGQVCFQVGSPVKNPGLSTNTFCAYQNGAWITMGAIMSAGLALKWFAALFGGDCSFAGIDGEAEKVPAGSGGLLFLPYLAGERTPHMNPDLRGAFLGLGLGMGRAEMARAVMEGVAFALTECIEVCSGLGLSAAELIASGGGARSALWLQIQADIFGIPIKVAETEEQAALGAACVAAAGAGMYQSVAEASSAMVRYKDKRYRTNERQHMIYREYYGLYKRAFKGCDALLSALTKFTRQGCCLDLH
jgi:xylulokinase